MVVITVFICFLPDLKNELLIWDDSGYVTDNVQIRSFSFATVSWAFTTFYCNYWAPLTWVSYMIDYAIWGLNPAGYHLTNNILHAVNAGLVMLVVKELLQRYRATAHHSTLLNDRNILYGSVIAALFFGVHPLRVESVAWAAERKDVLSFFFAMPAVLAYVAYTREEAGRFATSRNYWVAMLFYSLSLCSKAMFVTLPFVLLLFDWFPLQRFQKVSFRQLIIEKLPMLVLAVGVSVLTSLSQTAEMISLDNSSMLSRILNAFKSFMMYFWLTLMPFDISPFYLHQGNITEIGIEYVIAVIFFVAVTGISLFVMKRYPVVLTAWLFYLITLVPVIGISAVGPTAMAARFSYLPGLSLAILFALAVLWCRERTKGGKVAQALLFAVVGFVMVTFCLVTVKHIGFWKDDVALWTRAIDLKPNFSGRMYFQRGAGYAMKGDHKKALLDYSRAAEIAVAKGYRAMHTIYVERARSYREIGDFTSAIDDYTRCLESDTSQQRSIYLLERGNIYKLLGNIELANKDFADSQSAGQMR